MAEKVIVGISHGDFNGIGYEIILKTFQDARIFDFCTPVIYGSPKYLKFYAELLGIEKLHFNTTDDINKLAAKKLNILNCIDDSEDVQLGVATEKSGKAAFDALKKAVADLKDNKIGVLVTAPINKHNIQSEDFKFPGHTEYLESELNGKSLMMMTTDKLKVAVVTGHIAVEDVKKNLTQEVIVDRLQTLSDSLKQDFKLTKPKIAVLGLNPHAGENGLLGEEEISTIKPAIEAAKAKGIMAFGPYPADGFFGNGTFNKFDATLAMYHDQGLIPFKTISFGQGVNYTAGLDKIRTSPDHGTGYDIAGKGKSEESSFRSALYMAIDVYRNRQFHEEINKNPLPISDKRRMVRMRPSKDEAGLKAMEN